MFILNQVFNYRDDKCEIAFNIVPLTEFLNRCDENKLAELGVVLAMLVMNEDTYNQCVTKNGVEENRVAMIDPNDDHPGILARWGDGSGECLIDGNHRFVSKYRVGIREMLIWLVPQTVWEQFATIKEK